MEVVRKALALGINFIDTAEAYGTEKADSEIKGFGWVRGACVLQIAPGVRPGSSIL